MEHSPRFIALVERIRPGIKEVDVQSVAQRISAGDTFHLVDVREAEEFEAGRLPGAEHIGKGVIERDIEKAIPDPAADIVLYCGGGYRSAIVADSLQRMGYTNVKSMAGGVRAWKDAGLEWDDFRSE